MIRKTIKEVVDDAVQWNKNETAEGEGIESVIIFGIDAQVDEHGLDRRVRQAEILGYAIRRKLADLIEQREREAVEEYKASQKR